MRFSAGVMREASDRELDVWQSGSVHRATPFTSHWVARPTVALAEHRFLQLNVK